MSDFRFSAKTLNLGIIGLSLYTAIEGSQKIKIQDIIATNESVPISKTYIVGGSIALAVLAVINFMLLHSLYDYSDSLNLTYKIFGIIITSAILLLGSFLLAQFIEMNYLKKNKSTIYQDSVFPDDIETVGLVLGGVCVATGLYMILNILFSWGKSQKKIKIRR